MSQVWIDQDAINNTHSCLSAMSQDIQHRAAQHNQLVGDIERALSNAWGEMTHILDPAHALTEGDVWDRFGFDGLLMRYVDVRGSVEQFHSTATTSLTQLCQAHAGQIGADFAEHAARIQGHLANAHGGLWNVSGLLNPGGIIWLASNAWELVNPLTTVYGELLAADSAIIAFIAKLNEVSAEADQLIANLANPNGVQVVKRTNGTPTSGPQIQPARSAGQVAGEIEQQYGHNTPIGITRMSNGELLVTLTGLEIWQLSQVNNGATAAEAYFDNANNPYDRAVQQAIRKYLIDHHMPTDGSVKIVFAGHSLGGMVAQELAGGHNQDFTVADVITFGSPQVSAYNPHVHYTQYFDQYDPVPLLSWYRDKSLVTSQVIALGPVGGLVSSGKVLSQINTTPAVKQAFTGETYVPDTGTNPHFTQWFTDHNVYQNSPTLNSQPISGLSWDLKDVQSISWSQTTYYSTAN